MLRVSNTLMAKNMQNYIQNNLQRTAKTQEQIATGKTINRASDNPSEISHLMAINATLVKNEQYISNIDDGLSYLEQSDTSLDTLGKMLQNAKALSVEAANGTMTPEDMDAVAEQIDRQIDAMVDLSNSALGGKYLFAGRDNGQPPFYRDPDSGDIYYRGDTELITREITFGYSYEVVAAGVTASTASDEGVFGKLTDSSDPANQIDDPMNPGEKMTKVTGGVFDVLSDLVKNLRSGDPDAIQDSLDQIDVAHDEVLKHRVAVGARTKHLEAVKNQLEDQEVNLKGSLNTIQGADITALTIEAAENRLVYQASLMTASDLLKTSLLDYLR